MKRAPLLLIPVLASLLCPLAVARPRHPVFEPEDLEMERAGQADVDLGFGLVRDGQAWRTVAPDFEMDLGLTQRLELGLDGTFAWASRSTQQVVPRLAVPDNVWLSLKHALWTSRQEGDRTAQAIGLQHGVRLPMAPRSTGVGYQILALFGTSARARRLVLNLGAFVEPRTTLPDMRPWGLLAGLDVQVDLDDGAWQVQGNLAVTGHGEDQSGEATVSAGLLHAFGQRLEVYALGIGGWLNGGPAYGLMAGVSPKVGLWR